MTYLSVRRFRRAANKGCQTSGSQELQNSYLSCTNLEAEVLERRLQVRSVASRNVLEVNTSLSWPHLEQILLLGVLLLEAQSFFRRPVGKLLDPAAGIPPSA